MKIVFTGEVTDGKLRIYDRNTFDNEMHSMNGKVTVTVERMKKDRSVLQNKYYWGCMIPYVREGMKGVGYLLSQSETHEFLLSSFSRVEVCNTDTGEILADESGKPMTRIVATSEMSTIDFMDYKEKIQQWASEFLKIYIPDPEKQAKFEF